MDLILVDHRVTAELSPLKIFFVFLLLPFRPAPWLNRLILCLVAPAHRVLVPVGAPDSVPVPLFQASSLLWPGSAVEDGPSGWVLHPMGYQDKHLAPAFGTARCAGRSAPAAAAIGG